MNFRVILKGSRKGCDLYEEEIKSFISLGVSEYLARVAIVRERRWHTKVGSYDASKESFRWRASVYLLSVSVGFFAGNFLFGTLLILVIERRMMSTFTIVESFHSAMVIVCIGRTSGMTALRFSCRWRQFRKFKQIKEIAIETRTIQRLIDWTRNRESKCCRRWWIADVIVRSIGDNRIVEASSTSRCVGQRHLVVMRMLIRW
jgi:hypothetical protein